MTYCNITGCNHHVNRRMGKTTGWYWKEYQVCNCCALELFNMGVIGKGRKIGKFHNII